MSKNQPKAPAAAPAPQAPPAGDQTNGANTQDTAGEQQPTVELVAMVRDEDHYPPPHRAEVHPDEVANYANGGWVPAQ